MNITIDLTDLIIAVITVIIAIVSKYLIPWFKTQVSAKTLDTIKVWVKVAVEAAEQLYRETGKGAEKKAYVLEFLESKGFTVNASEIDNLIESAVHELNK